MALRINKEIETINKGPVSNPYVRIESYHIEKMTGIMRISIALFSNKEDADLNKFTYIEELSNPLMRRSQTGPISPSIIVDGKSLQYPTLFDIPLFVEEVVTEEIYETKAFTRNVSYWDFDENGEIVEKTREETYTDRVVTGVNPTKKSKIDLSVIGENPYSFAYSKLKPMLEEIFGEGNITDF